jgi:ankyrin repeat protein
MTMKRGIRSGVLAVALGLSASAGVFAQVPPLAAEVLAYEGLHRSAWHGNLPKLKSLISSGANLDAYDARGRTPLHVATYARQREAVKLLAKAGANLDQLEDDRYDAVTIASVADDVTTLTLLLSLGANAGQTTSRYDGTALIAAAHLGHDEVVRRLIAAGAPLDHVNNLHWTAVIESIVLGDGGQRHQRTLAALVDAGASLKLSDRQGNTPLQLARARGYTAMVKLLEGQRAR